MKIRFTDKGDMEVLLENDLERDIFPCIERDARALGEEWLSDSLSPDFDDPWFTNWQEWVQPEVQERFDEQLSSLNKFSKPVGEMLFIPQAHVEAWYGAVNQARIALETIFHFSEEEIPDNREELMSKVEQWAEDKQGGYQRFHFYGWFQEILLEGLVHFVRGGGQSRNGREQNDEPGND